MIGGVRSAGVTTRLQHSRIFVVAVLILYFACVSVKVRHAGWTSAWTMVGVQSMSPLADLALDLQTLDRYRARTPTAEIQKKVAYPPLWMWMFAPTGPGEPNTLLLSLIVGGIPTVVAILYLGRLSLIDGIFATFLISPSSMLGIERGNRQWFELARLGGRTCSRSAYDRIHMASPARSQFKREPCRDGFPGRGAIHLFFLLTGNHYAYRFRRFNSDRSSTISRDSGATSRARTGYRNSRSVALQRLCGLLELRQSSQPDRFSCGVSRLATFCRRGFLVI